MVVILCCNYNIWKDLYACMFSLLHHRLSDANQSDSSGEEQELQVQLLPADGVSSKESIRTAVSERGHRLVCIYYNIILML